MSRLQHRARLLLRQCMRRGSVEYKKCDEEEAKVAAFEEPTGRAALRIAGLFFRAKATRRKAFRLALTVLVVLFAESSAGLYYSLVQKKFMTALQEKNAEGFYSGLRQTGCLILFISPIVALHHYTAQQLKVAWKASLTYRFGHAYLAGDSPGQCIFYRLTLTSDIDNPDERILADVNDFVDIMFSLVQDSVGIFFGVTGFSVMLYQISPAVCLGTVLYALLGTLVATMGFGPRIMRFQAQLVVQDAGLRYTLIRTRENAESIAFFRGGAAEWQRFWRLYNEFIASTQNLIVVSVGMSVFNQSFHWATFAVAPLLVGPKYMRGEVEFGTIAQVVMAFNTILGGLTIIMNRIETLTGFAVRIRRLRGLELALEEQEARAREARRGGAGCGCIAAQPLPSGGSTVLNVRHITLRTPPRAGVLQQTLVDGLSLQVSHGQFVLIAGQSGIGKSSFLRAVAGLWSDGSGHVELCREGSFFMPQKPYMFIGSLREQLLYPQLGAGTLDDTALEAAMREVNLGYLLEYHGLGDTKEWSTLLSLGEQQRINFARVLLQRDIRVALIDEGTSACDPANEAHLYNLLRSRLQSYISVGHRPALRRYHTHALWLQRQTAVSRGPADCSFLPMADFEKLAWSPAESAAS